MAELQIEDAELVLHLSSVEKMESLHGDVRVPLFGHGCPLRG
jgi:hypothetical protein